MEPNLRKRVLGIKPRWLHDLHRFCDIMAAINRALYSETEIRVEWIEEYNELVGRVKCK